MFGSRKKEENTRQVERSLDAPDGTGSRRDLEPGQRVQRAVESILENEALGTDLHDDAAGRLLRWGTTWAQDLARSTLELDEDTARQALEPRLRAVRRMMRAVSQFAAQGANMDETGRLEALQNILERARHARGGLADEIDEGQKADWANRLAELADQPAQAVAELHKIIEEAIIPND